MGVPLGHKNHTSRRSSGKEKPFKFERKYFTRKYKIIDNTYVLTADEKTLVCFNPETRGLLKIPEGVTRIDAYGMKYSPIDVLVVPNSVEYINYIPVGLNVLIFKGQIPACDKPDKFYSLREVIVSQESDIEKVKTICEPHIYDIRCEKDRFTYFRTTSYYVDLEKTKIDEQGVLYSEDGKILLKYNLDLPNYEIPEGVDTISEKAFQGSKINHITLPKSMRVIGEKAFAECHSLESITFNKGLKFIFDKAFEDCDKLKSISLPDSLLRMCSFVSCKSLENAKLPRNLKKIPQSAFSGTSISKISIPQSIEIIGDSAFYSTNISTIKLPNNLKEIGPYAFGRCKKLKAIRIPKTVKNIPSFIFLDCTQLKKVIIEGNVESISNGAFNNCESLKTIEFQNFEEIGKEAFRGCISLKDIILPDGLKIINPSIFDGCVNLNTLILPEGVKRIEYGFIANTSIKGIDIPASVEYIDRAFRDANKLEVVRFLGQKAFGRSATSEYWKPKNDDDVFESCPNLREIHIPHGSYNIYKEKYPSFVNMFIED